MPVGHQKKKKVKINENLNPWGPLLKEKVAGICTENATTRRVRECLVMAINVNVIDD